MKSLWDLSLVLPPSRSCDAYTLPDGQRLPHAITGIVQAIHGPVASRQPQVRQALAAYLRSRHHPDQLDADPWEPHAPAFQPWISIIRPLLLHPYIQQHGIVAAPFTVRALPIDAGGSADFISISPQGAFTIGALYTGVRTQAAAYAAAAELGAIVAAFCDHPALTGARIEHCLEVWARPGETEVFHSHPDGCLGQWVDTADLFRFRQSAAASFLQPAA